MKQIRDGSLRILGQEEIHEDLLNYLIGKTHIRRRTQGRKDFEKKMWRNNIGHSYH